jgi:hypothetical protein
MSNASNPPTIHHDPGSEKELQPDDFVVGGKDIAANEAQFVAMMALMVLRIRGLHV